MENRKGHGKSHFAGLPFQRGQMPLPPGLWAPIPVTYCADAVGYVDNVVMNAPTSLFEVGTSGVGVPTPTPLL